MTPPGCAFVEVQWVTQIALRATSAWRHSMDDEYEVALLDVLAWWLTRERAATPNELTIPRLRGWAKDVTEAYERADTIDVPALLALWGRAQDERR